MLVTIPLPTGSPTCTKTIWIVRVSWSTAAVRGVDSVTIRLGCKSTSSFANLRTKSASELDQRRSSRMLRPSVHPKSCSRLRSAAIRACPSASVSGNDPSTPMRRVPSGCCAPAASGHATAAPPSATSNSRRPMVTIIRPSRARCVKRKDTTPPVCSLHVRGGRNAGCYRLLCFRSGKAHSP